MLRIIEHSQPDFQRHPMLVPVGHVLSRVELEIHSVTTM